VDAGNLLKPALARGELRCIGATTLDEYRKHIEKDAALERRFQPVLVDQPNVEDTIAILRGLKERYEAHHGVRIKTARSSRRDAVHRYIADRFLPDKAIDLIDEAASPLRIENDSLPTELDELRRRIMQLEIEREALKKEKDGASVQGALERDRARAGGAAGERRGAERAVGGEKAELDGGQGAQGAARREADRARAGAARGRPRAAARSSTATSPSSRQLTRRSEKLDERRPTGDALLREEVDRARRSPRSSPLDGHPGRRLLEGEREKLQQMETRLRERVVGAGRRAAGGVRRGAPQPGRAGRSRTARSARSCSSARPASARPRPQGAGRVPVRHEDAMIRIDMSEYMEKHACRG
jgi:ATP-dependent Clp protease ATP-binding subunit ClpB